MANTLVLGSTGMVGAHILSTLRSASPTHVGSVATISRRPPAQDTSPSALPISPVVDPDTSTWPAHLQSLSPFPSVLFSALATTRAAAGGFDKQYALEHDLNVELARAARESGAKTYVLVSASSASPTAYFNYSRMKGEIEEHVKELGFEHTVILRPGLIAGRREETRVAEGIVRFVADVLGKVSGNRLKDFWAQDADVIARAAVSAALKAERGDIKEKVLVLDGGAIVALGRTEWKDLK